MRATWLIKKAGALFMVLHLLKISYFSLLFIKNIDFVWLFLYDYMIF
jgi:hypothetical protein